MMRRSIARVLVSSKNNKTFSSRSADSGVFLLNSCEEKTIDLPLFIARIPAMYDFFMTNHGMMTFTCYHPLPKLS